MKIIIEPVDYGAIYTIVNDEGHARSVYAFEEDDLDDLVGMLHDLVEDIGMDGSRHSKERIRVTVAHGDKFMCTEKQKDCPICANL